jgi:pimeloyl-ACP methyl ester carboxylesterase
VHAYRDGRRPLELRDRTVIVVDDGLATGLTVLAAIRAVRRRGAGRVIVAVPVGARESVARVGEEADEVVCHTIPRDLRAVGRWYRDFHPVEDAEVLAALDPGRPDPPRPRPVRLDLEDLVLEGDLTIPSPAQGLVIFAHGSGSSRLSRRNRAVARSLGERGFATLLFDLLTQEEAQDRALVFDIPLLARRLELAMRWAVEVPALHGLGLGLFGASTGAAAAFRAAAAAGDAVRAVVSRGGRPDLAADRLPQVRAASLLIVGGADRDVLELNLRAAELLRCPHRVEVVEGAGHLFEEPGALDAVARLAGAWFERHLPAGASRDLAGARG